MAERKDYAMKYRHVVVYYPKDVDVSSFSLGEYINELFAKGIDAVQIVRRARHEVPADVSLPPEPPYVAVQGNVGSS